ncbi:lysylphosphatidylglycerol synthase transmembrane domain-containing protein [Levilactobacillus namurensis]|uniref:lysylphosphatidylglycerol synthase transmembrane domain-containing protein n=1 Tax=Levilactobacillus namurensis TaxID=380393 RepID=UPI00223040F1|nr:lysylphosphatidylglycerol synthase transmembrane domain-containing protein [Levilactobacillus namurensis]MCW3779399.1 flippase-like domain-containing protein [Levilactobacillus namurensis]MDT7018234.1 lysylphosphatidylglycerol synthase transmembrane domain-containing protein [Levilactobacillus namurensis]WNN64779.1 lysylphosphatidylglycerol synthase transmembrane domain-containing protein [Levilactobacillus namurensis]
MSRRNKWVLTVMLLLGVAIFAFSLRDIKFSVLINDFVHINFWWFGVAVLCMVLYLGLEAVIVKVFISDRIQGFTFKDAVRIPLVEQLFNGITPFSSGGQPAQLIALMQTGVDAGKASSVLLMKFVVFQSMIVINFLIALVIGFNYIQDKLHALAWLVVFGFTIHLAVIVGLLMVMFWYGFTKRAVAVVLYPAHWFMKPVRYTRMVANINRKIDSFYAESVRISGQWRLMLRVFVITFIQLMFYYLIPYFIMLALGYTTANIVMVTSMHVLIVMVISLFPIPGGAGGAEYSFEMIFKSYIASNSKLVLAMILWRLLTYYFGMLAGLVAMVIRPDKVVEETDKTNA